ncbi:c-type cytochrome biogenesis protein CcmI [Cellvibrio zantedeschiae]|uniref:C-type cytochrome biogenesis protein CcmI n=1 Tax=Cellvibrio zantedeschiae TaxID=1237077 RepID=A0ABQ3B1P9_9GAMM|nr:c-type cytochrome biogenesis protein CcmI [Cellvibrio zantedeschiae]GGY71274.1 c-type cytochrome biogenesis protein CcmI [Cellvibrio zantedeschiae]
MIGLWSSLVVLMVIALAFFLWPLWRYKNSLNSAALTQAETERRLAENVRIFREHLGELENSLAAQSISSEEFSLLKVELERNLLADEASLRAQQLPSSQRLGVKVAVGFTVLVLVFGVFFYRERGNLIDVYIQNLQQEKLQLDYQDMIQNKDPNPARAQQLITEFESRLQQKPDNVQYWFLLARAQMEVGNFAEGAKAYQRVLELDSKSAMIMAELAQALFLRDGNKTTPEAVDLAKQALALDPKNTMALGLLGIDAYSKKDYRATIRYWQKSVDLLSPDSQGRRALLAGIEKAKQSYIAEGGKAEDLISRSAYAVKLSVSLGDKVKATSDQVVFIYARAWQGSPMPLAIARIKVSDLPTTIQLDETMAMSPAASLATATDIEVVARISPSGSAKAEPGDWIAKQGPVSMAAIPEKIDLLINEQVSTN